MRLLVLPVHPQVLSAGTQLRVWHSCACAHCLGLQLSAGCRIQPSLTTPFTSDKQVLPFPRIPLLEKNRPYCTEPLSIPFHMPELRPHLSDRTQAQAPRAGCPLHSRPRAAQVANHSPHLTCLAWLWGSWQACSALLCSPVPSGIQHSLLTPQPGCVWTAGQEQPHQLTRRFFC